MPICIVFIAQTMILRSQIAQIVIHCTKRRQRSMIASILFLCANVFSLLPPHVAWIRTGLGMTPTSIAILIRRVMIRRVLISMVLICRLLGQIV